MLHWYIVESDRNELYVGVHLYFSKRFKDALACQVLAVLAVSSHSVSFILFFSHANERHTEGGIVVQPEKDKTLYNVDTLESLFFFYSPCGISRTQTWLYQQNHKSMQEPFQWQCFAYILACAYEYNHLSNKCIHAFSSCFSHKDAYLSSSMFFPAIIPTLPISNEYQTLFIIVCII